MGTLLSLRWLLIVKENLRKVWLWNLSLRVLSFFFCSSVFSCCYLLFLIVRWQCQSRLLQFWLQFSIEITAVGQKSSFDFILCDSCNVFKPEIQHKICICQSLFSSSPFICRLSVTFVIKCHMFSCAFVDIIFITYTLGFNVAGILP